MRYFAPQYGVDEDLATSSVLPVLASALENDYNCLSFTITQASSTSARMSINNQGQYIAINGKLRHRNYRNHA